MIDPSRCAALDGTLARGLQVRASRPNRALVLVRAHVEGLTSVVRHEILAIGQDERQIGLVRRAILPAVDFDVLTDFMQRSPHGLEDRIQRQVVHVNVHKFGEIAQDQKEKYFRIGCAQNIALELRENISNQLGSDFLKVVDIAIMNKNPFSELERMGIENVQFTCGSASKMGYDGLRSNDTRDAFENPVIDGACYALDNMRATAMIIRHAPAVGV